MRIPRALAPSLLSIMFSLLSSCGLSIDRGGSYPDDIATNGWKLPPTGAVTRRYPKLVNYYHFSPNETQADMRSERLAQWDIVIVFPYKAIEEGLSFAKMRQLNPDIVILAWIPIGQSPDASRPFGAGIPQGEGNWFLRDMNGAYVTFGAPYYEHIMNPYKSNYAWPKYIVDFAEANYLDTGLYDGVFLDCMCEVPLMGWSFDVDVDENGVSDYSDTLAWRDGMTYAASALKARCPGKLVTGNGGNPLSAASPYYDWIDGCYHENALGDEFGSIEWSGAYNCIWDGYQNAMIAGATHYMIGVDIRCGESREFDVAKSKNVLSRGDLRRMRLGLATSLLGDGYFGFDSGDCIHGQLWWFNEYDADLGSPLSAYAQDGSLYMRNYQNGVVYVNPTDADAERTTASMHKDWTTGESGDRFLIPARDGRILTKSQATRADNILLNGKFDFGTSRWGFWANNGGAGSISAVNGELKAVITDSATDIWDIGITQSQVPVENGASYTVTFRARADAPCDIICLAQLGRDPWTIYSGNDSFELDERMREFSYSFTMGHPTDPGAYFVFHLGGIGRNAVYIDDVRMRKDAGA